MKRTKISRSAIAAATALMATMGYAAQAKTIPQTAHVHHVLLVSVDGLHAQDLERYVAAHPQSELARLSAQGVTYTNAMAPAPVDSFPGLAALVTGGGPRTTGIYYDDSYDRRLFAAGSHCQGEPGTEVAYDESLDKDDGHGHEMIDQDKLPLDAAKGCSPVLPHSFIRVNTIFEVVKAAGGYTAWTDKHPAYEWVSGPSGAGVDDLFLPEIGANYEGLTDPNAKEITGSLAKTEAYDDMKAHAVLNEIKGLRHDGQSKAKVPNLMGLNLQSINVAQKIYGYKGHDGELSSGIDGALTHVDQVLLSFDKELEAQGLADDTLVIVGAKHGNGPIDGAKLHKIDNDVIKNVIDQAAPGALGQMTTDHGALIWLKDQKATAVVVKALEANKEQLGIKAVLSGQKLTLRFADAARDARVPDVVVVTKNGTIYTPPHDGKLAEHGGFHKDDEHVALVISNPKLADKGTSVTKEVTNTQVAPTILTSLGLSPRALMAVAAEGTQSLPKLEWSAATK